VVVVVGFTTADVPLTVPNPFMIVIVVAPATDQLSTLDCPAVIFVGVAVKLAMTGVLPAVTVTVAVVVPAEFVAVSM